MTYRDADGRQYMADNYDDLVNQMWHSDRPESASTLEEWMEAKAEHAKLWHDVTLRIDTPGHFAEDALIAGVLTVVEEG